MEDFDDTPRSNFSHSFIDFVREREIIPYCACVQEPKKEILLDRKILAYVCI